MPSRGTILALLAITCFGLALRLTNVRESLWLDELHTGWVVKQGWDEVAWRARIGNQSPFWFYGVKVVTTLGGESEATLRLLSLLAGTTLMPAVFWLVHLLSKSSLGGLLAAALVAVDRHCIFYATEARPYACLQLVAALQLGVFWRILQQPTNFSRVAWIVLTALAFHLHYTGILILLGELVLLAAYYGRSQNSPTYRLWSALVDWLVVAVLCVPALPHVLEVGERRSMWNSISDLPTLEALLSVFPLLQVTLVGAFAVCGGLIVRQWRLRHKVRQQEWFPLLTVTTWFIAPVLAAWLVARWDVAAIFSRRYLIALGIGPMLLSGLLLAVLPWRTLRVVSSLVLLAFAVYDSQIIEQLRCDGRAVGDRTEDWRGAIAWLRIKNDQQATILLDAALVEDEQPIDERSPGSNAEIQYRSFALRSLYYPGPAKIMPWSAYSAHRFRLKPGDSFPYYSVHRREADSELWSNVSEYVQFGSVEIINVTPGAASTSPPSPTPSASP